MQSSTSASSSSRSFVSFEITFGSSEFDLLSSTRLSPFVSRPTLTRLPPSAARFFSYTRTTNPQSYHIVQEIQKFNLSDYRPREEQFVPFPLSLSPSSPFFLELTSRSLIISRFQKAIKKVRATQRLRRSRGFAFSQTEGSAQEQTRIIRAYDTTQAVSNFFPLSERSKSLSLTSILSFRARLLRGCERGNEWRDEQPPSCFAFALLWQSMVYVFIY